MKNVFIKYDKMSNDIEVSAGDKSLDTQAITNMSIEQWAYPFMSNGKKWEGIYREICNLSGEEAFTIYFSGDDASYDVLRLVMEENPVGWKRINSDVTLIYKEDPLMTKVMLNGRVVDTALIQNRSIEEWINPFQAGGTSWEGIFKEISKIVNSEKYTINFVGNSDAYNKLINVCPSTVSLFLRDPKIVEALSVQNGKSDEATDNLAKEPIKSSTNHVGDKNIVYCRNCGEPMDPQAAMCVKCGFKKGTGNNYCQHCGCQVKTGQEVCLNCGFKLDGVSSGGSVSEDQRILCGIIAILFGSLGIHNFILGEWKKGVLHIILFVLAIPAIVSAIWGIVEGVRILNRSYEVNSDKWFA